MWILKDEDVDEYAYVDVSVYVDVDVDVYVDTDVDVYEDVDQYVYVYVGSQRKIERCGCVGCMYVDVDVET